MVEDVQVDDTFMTMNANVFEMLQELHIWTEKFNEKRLRRRAHQPITAMLLRTWEFKEPVILPQSDTYWGCFSWRALLHCSCLHSMFMVHTLHKAAFCDAKPNVQ